MSWEQNPKNAIEQMKKKVRRRVENKRNVRWMKGWEKCDEKIGTERDRLIKKGDLVKKKLKTESFKAKQCNGNECAKRIKLWCKNLC